MIPGQYHPIPDLTCAEVARYYSKMLLAGCGQRWGGRDFNNAGYGRFVIFRGGKRIRLLAHRVAYKLAFGVDPGQRLVCHGCDTPPCCTPDCFTLGTGADNVWDAICRRRLNMAGLLPFRAARIALAAVEAGADWKPCTRCGRDKPLTEFDPEPHSPDGRSFWCSACVAGNQALTSLSHRLIASVPA